MPKNKIDYSQTVIYKISCNDPSINKVYIGMTADFDRTKNEIEASCIDPENKKYNCEIYKFIRNNGNWDNWTMTEIEKYPCNDRKEAHFFRDEKQIKEQRKAKKNCICGKSYTYNHKSRHLKSKFHENFLKTQ